jgi:hypothetical protein
LTYIVDDEVYKEYDVDYGTEIIPEDEPTKYGYEFSGWSWIPKKMPAEDVYVSGTFTTTSSIDTIHNGKEVVKILSLDGKELDTYRKGINIVVYKDGTKRKVVK